MTCCSTWLWQWWSWYVGPCIYSHYGQHLTCHQGTLHPWSQSHRLTSPSTPWTLCSEQMTYDLYASPNFPYPCPHGQGTRVHGTGSCVAYSYSSPASRCWDLWEMMISSAQERMDCSTLWSVTFLSCCDHQSLCTSAFPMIHHQLQHQAHDDVYHDQSCKGMTIL